MGMAASQARLLTITARLADNELRSQTINNAKMRLATESAQASDDYVTALNNARLMFKNMDLTGTSQSQLLTFNSLSSYSPYNTQYGLVNSAGLLLVNESEAKIFEKSGNNLEKFLENHGLKWDTTYFNEDKNLKSRLESYYMDDSFKLDENDTEGLSFLFSDKDTSALKTLYETYLSKDVSIERANFSTANTEYLSLKTSLYSQAVQSIIEHIQGYTGATTYSEMANVLGQKDENTLKNDLNYLSDDFWEIHNNLTVSGKEYTQAPKELSEFSSGSVELTTTDIDGTALTSKVKYDKYTFGGATFYIDQATNNVKYITIAKDDDKTYYYNTSSTSITFTESTSADYKYYKVTGSSQFSELSIKSSADNPETKYKKGVDSTTGKTVIYNSKIYADETSAKAAKWEELLSLIMSNPDMIELEKAPISSASTYINTRDAFYNQVFAFEEGKTIDDYSDLKDIIDNVAILNDFGAFIQYIHEYQTANDGQPAFTSSFQNIIDAFTVELMLDELGEPKYAWVDTQDSLNEGNADAKAQWYENLFNRMRKGYAVLEDGLASSPEWIEHAFESGIVTMEQVDKSYNWLSIDYKCCANITEDTDNSAAVAIAEAKYNRAMNDIKRKDNMFDMELKNIDTEHNALQTEYDVIKGVIAKNIERTMKFDQSA